MKLAEQRFLRGPNLYSRRQCYLAVLDLEELDEVSSTQIAGFNERLLELIPTLNQHRCSPGHIGGFVERLRDGTYMAHIVEHVTIELQCLAGNQVGFGRARMIRGKPRHYRVVCAYRLECVVEQAMALAIELVTALSRGEGFDLQTPLKALQTIADRHAIGTSTGAVIDAARKRGIPTLRITEDANLFQFGWGSRQKRLQATITGETGYIAVKIASDKHLTKALLQEASLPVPRGDTVQTVDGALRAARKLRGPVTVKPLDANQGKGVTVAAQGTEEITRAFEHARRFSRNVIVEDSIQGHDYRVLVTGGRIAAASRRRPPCVTGDGVKTVRELVELENLDPARGDGHSNILTKIALDEHARQVLSKQGFDFDSVPAAGTVAILRDNANLSTGGTAEDVTDMVHPETRDICIRAAQKIGLDIAGVDLVCTDISRPLKEQRGAIIELNAAPGIRMHEFPARGQRRDAGGAIVESMFGPGNNGRIPVIAVTGTNGKTTTTLLISHCVRLAGLNTGTTTTEGIFINGRAIHRGDCTGYWSAKTLLTSPDVDAAVLETARGGILKRGLAFDRCDVAVVLNVTGDHLGLDGVETVGDLARVKGVVASSASRAAVLNAEDAHCVAMAERLITGCEAVYFSMDPEHPVLLRHLDQGGRAAYLQDGWVVLADGSRRHALVKADSMPISMQGHARYNIANALAASAALTAAGYSPEQIVPALSSFTSDARHNPLRCNIFDVHGVTVIVDYAHNTAAYKAVSEMARSMLSGSGARLVGVVTAPGDRRDKDLIEVGQICGRGFDELVVYESDPRGRAAGETSRIMLDGARSIGSDLPLHDEADVRDALVLGLGRCQKGDLLVFTCATTLKDLVEAVRRTDPESAGKIAEEIE